MSKIFFVFLLLIASTAFGQTAKDTMLDLYLLIGQSNMAGRGVVAGEYATETDPRVWMLDKENKWVPAKHPLHFDKPAVVGVGPGLSFGIEMAKVTPQHRIGLIPCAVGGTSIDVWKEGAYDAATKTHPYDDMLVRLSVALKSGKLKGIVWHQGESDSKPEQAKEWLPKLKALIEKLRVLVDDATLPFVAGELGRYSPAFNTINIELQKLAVPYTAVATSEGLVNKGDTIHFDSPSAELFGVRLAEKMKLLQKKNK